QRVLSLCRLLFGGGVGGGVGVLFLEALDAAGRVHEFLLAGKEGVATGANFDAQHVALDGRTRLESMPASAVDGNGVVIGVDPGFHEFSNPSWPVCAGTGKRGVTAASLGHETICNYTAIPRERKTDVITGSVLICLFGVVLCLCIGALLTFKSLPRGGILAHGFLPTPISTTLESPFWTSTSLLSLGACGGDRREDKVRFNATAALTYCGKSFTCRACRTASDSWDS